MGTSNSWLFTIRAVLELFVPRNMVAQLRCLTLTLFVLFVLLFCYLITDGPAFRADQYPLNIDLYKAYQETTNPTNQHPQANLPEPINNLVFKTLKEVQNFCQPLGKPIDFLLIIRTIASTFEQRAMIRKTWANLYCYERLHYNVKTLFTLARFDETSQDAAKIQKRLEHEQYQHNDIVQFEFPDAYENLTYKLMASLDFVLNHCSQTKFLVFVDDDILVNPLNLVKLLDQVRQSGHYDHYVAGDVLPNNTPVRNPFIKCYIPVSLYPYSNYPPYPSGGTMILSRTAAQMVLFGMRFTKLFPIDDVYLGIVLMKLGIAPIHIEQIYSIRPIRTRLHDIITLHGYGDPVTLSKGWQKIGMTEVCPSSG